jgi:hypothetical protein
MKLTPIILCLCAGLLLVGGWVVAADSTPAVRSPAAKAAMIRAERACRDAEALARRTKVSAKKQLVADLQKVQREVLTGGNLDEANAIKMQIDRTELEIKQLTVKVPDDAVRLGGNRYKLSNQVVTWEVARKLCEAAGGQLAVINNADEDRFLTDYALQNHDAVWIGFHRQNGAIVSVDGSEPTYSHWMGNQPDNAGGHEPYVELHRAGWNDMSNAERPFICEWPNVDN